MPTNQSELSKSTFGVKQPKGFPGLPAGWVSEWETFKSADGQAQLFSITHHREPWVGPRALVIVHGMFEHAGRYQHVPYYVQEVVDAVHCIDLQGHGRSEGIRGHIENFDFLRDDVALAVKRLDEKLKKRFGKSEIHLLGHSMGGMIVLRTLLAHPDLPLRSVSVSSPCLGVKVKVPAVKKAAAHVLKNIWGSLQLSAVLDAGLISHDPAVVETYVSDRLVHNKMTPKFFTLMTAAMENTVKHDTLTQVPLQFLVPLEDGVVDPEVELSFFKKLKDEKKRLKTYPGFFHEGLNEIGKEKMFADLVSWIRANP